MGEQVGDGVRGVGGVRGLAGDIGPEGTRRLEGFRGRQRVDSMVMLESTTDFEDATEKCQRILYRSTHTR